MTSACRSHSAFPSHHACASPAPRASLRQSRASPRGCCRVRPHPTTLRAVVSFFYAAACSACRSHSALPSRHAVASPAPRASLRQSRASPRGCCRVRPHPTTLNAVVTFSYAAAYSACRSHAAFSSHHASASPAHRASLRQSRASPVGCCRVRPHPTTL